MIGGVLEKLVRMRKAMKKRTIIVGLKSDTYSREVLLRLLTLVAAPGDNVLAVHVLEPNDTFDPNSFHIHEDLCKSKQVEFQLKVCGGDSYITELSHQVRINFATILVLGCSSPWPNNSTIASCLKALPPTCSLLVVDNGGRILMQRQGTSQEGSTTKVLKSSLSSVSIHNYSEPSRSTHQIQKSLSLPSSSKSKPLQQSENLSLRKPMTQELFQRLATLEIKGSRRFMPKEISCATNEFSSDTVIGEGGNSKVYRANLEDDGCAAAVKVLKITEDSAEELFREMEILSSLKHENIVQVIGFCYSKGVHAIVYNLLEGSLKQKLRRLRWSERMRIAIGVGKALQYLHSCCPPIIHRDVKSSNILLSDECQPQLSDFGAAIVHQQDSGPFRVVGTFGYLAPEYLMYGKVDEKVDVYSYGVVLLELITGKEAIQATQEPNHQSLVLWFENVIPKELQARSLLSSGLYERLIDPHLNEDYDKDEMQMMMTAARLCLWHSSSRRPAMETILQLFEEPQHWLKMQREREELFNGISCNGETGFCKDYSSSDSNEAFSIDHFQP